VLGDRPPAPAAGTRHQKRAEQAAGESEGDAQTDIFEHEMPPHEMGLSRFERCGEGQHRGQSEAVVHPRLEVERVADHAGHAGIGHDTGGEHRVRRGEQRAEQQALAPAQPDQPAGQGRNHQRGHRHRHDELAQRQVPVALQHLAVDLEAVAEQDHDQRHVREVAHEAGARVEVQHAERALAEHEPGQDEQGRQRQQAAPRESGQERADHQQATEDRRGRLERRHARSLPQPAHGFASRAVRARAAPPRRVQTSTRRSAAETAWRDGRRDLAS